MSHALKRVRAITGDDLFKKTSGGFVMTRYCTEIFPAVRRIIEDTESRHAVEAKLRACDVPPWHLELE